MNEITNISKRNTSSKSILVAARVVGTIWLVICLFGFISFFLEGTQRHTATAPKPPDILGIATVVCFLVAFCGLIIAWCRAGLGGFISLFGFIIAGVLFKLNPNFIFSLPFFVFILMPSILYLAYWWNMKKSFAKNSKA